MKAETVINVVLLVVAVVSLWIAIAAYKDAHASGEDQLKALGAARQAIVDTGSQQQKTLEGSRQALEGVLNTVQQQEAVTREALRTAHQQQTVLSQQLQTMQSLTSVAQEQWKRANEQPAIMVMAFGYVGKGRAVLSAIPPQGELSAGYDVPEIPRLISFLVRNVGTAPLRRPKVIAQVEGPGVVECVSYRYYNPDVSKPCEVKDVELPGLEPDIVPTNTSRLEGRQSDLAFFVVLKIPEGSKQLKIHFAVSADNLTAGTYSVNAWLMGREQK